MAIFGWIVLALVFVDELLAMAAFGIWGWQHDPGWVLVWLLPLVAMLGWYFFASPKAAYGGPVFRPVAKVIVFSLATLALWDSGHETWAWMFVTFSIVVNALALLPSIRVLVENE
ncbi:DUF2568 domain-containing protein [Nocardioides humilatus]|uniref:DUF2568 domain-containing protein n=1 Tax=Nocardioides humilatus TaxID=2607660 RepID=A0A5B1LNK8_9ACTN|nr:YrdB family protein [Nocardioides humilatus]KAA1421698.1 DUF2568 domain-containing protein [Nocardioides humilatus]